MSDLAVAPLDPSVDERKIRPRGGPIRSPLHSGAPMRAWIRTMLRRHLIADDPLPKYSRLDQLDGLPEAPARAQEADRLGPDQERPDTCEREDHG